MKHLLRLSDLGEKGIYEVFRLADELGEGKHRDALCGKTAVLFFPSASLRTRVTFEKGIASLGGHPILFPPETLEKKEELKDVARYLGNWADLIVVRHRDIRLLEELAAHSPCPVINAMTDENHPCEILSDLYALSRIRKDFRSDHYLFCGEAGNIGRTWKEAAEILNLSFVQSCPPGFELDGVKVCYDPDEAAADADIVCTDAWPPERREAFRPWQITSARMEHARPGALLNPCPPFTRGEEVSEDAVASPYFAGYSFKSCLLEVQQAVLLYCMG
ncbi:MAG TPA: peptide transporter [Candidatus Eisenbergiella merdavium]|uniref:Peptide transporter n=1 Tax=Candidatus Eisenbergiella merdavium TaxID=2838551 RepID=A0A9D2NJU9_9FIRM|nr:peptide transporter [Candidatus Eisenbergiella merdavium]